MAKKEKYQWINEVMQSTDKMQRAMPPDDLFQRIERRVHLGVNKVKKVPLRTVMATAASIALLILANIYVLMSGAAQTKENNGGVDAVIEYYGLNNNEILYR